MVFFRLCEISLRQEKTFELLLGQLISGILHLFGFNFERGDGSLFSSFLVAGSARTSDKQASESLDFQRACAKTRSHLRNPR
jgi:hypothetical protein